MSVPCRAPGGVRSLYECTRLRGHQRCLPAACLPACPPARTPTGTSGDATTAAPGAAALGNGAAAQGMPPGPFGGPGGAMPGAMGMGMGGMPPGFESAARREHAAERMALIAQHQQEEQEKQELMVGRVTCMCLSLCVRVRACLLACVRACVVRTRGRDGHCAFFGRCSCARALVCGDGWGAWGEGVTGVSVSTSQTNIPGDEKAMG